MIVEKLKRKIKCDANGCDNYADYTIINKKYFFSGNVYLCSACLNNLYGEIGKFVKPKNIKPIYKKGEKNEI